MPRKISKSEYDLPSHRVDLAPNIPSNNICSACVCESMIYYVPFCRHVIRERGYKYTRMCKRSLDSNASSNFKNDSFNGKITYENKSSRGSDDYYGPNYTESDIDKLNTRIQQQEQQLLVLQAEQEQKVLMYLKALNDNRAESENSFQFKKQFEVSNREANERIHELQERLGKHHNHLKRIEQHRAQSEDNSSNKLLQVVHDQARHLRSRAESFQDNVVGHLGHLTELARRTVRSKSMDDMKMLHCGLLKPTITITPPDDCCDDNNNNNTDTIQFFNSGKCDQDNFAQPRGKNSLKEEPVRKTGVVLANIFHQYLPNDTASTDEELSTFRERLDSLETDGHEMREGMEKVKEMLSKTLQSFADEKYSIRVLTRRMRDLEDQWHNITEFHQNETSSIREEIERTFECFDRIEYWFADKNSELFEEIESCCTRLSVVEQESEGRDHPADQRSESKLLLSKLVCSYVRICIGVVMIAMFSTRSIASSLSRWKRGLISVLIGMISVSLYLYL